LKVIWNKTPYLENTQMANSLASSAEVIVLDVRMKIACLESQLTIIRIVSKLEENESFSMKSINIEFCISES